MDYLNLDNLAAEFEANRERLRHIAMLRMSPLLFNRIGVDDLLQETWLAANRRLEHFARAAEVPVFIRLRTLLLQTIIDMERKYLACKKRDAGKDISFDQQDGVRTEVEQRWNMLADTIASPRTQLARADRHTQLREALAAMPENDRVILELRHFEDLSNRECAAALGIEAKAASIRYIRALKNLQQKLDGLTEFRR